MKDTLKMLRNRTDEIDRTISKLLDLRADIVRKIGIVKRNNCIAVVDKKRERDILKKVTLKKRNKGFLKNCFQTIIKESKKIQK